MDEPQVEKVAAYALDNLVAPDEKITYIKMDIEGAEYDSLKGAERIIRSHKPNLAISIYHQPMDYVNIPAYGKSIVPSYQLFFHHYATYNRETVYAMPKKNN